MNPFLLWRSRFFQMSTLTLSALLAGCATQSDPSTSDSHQCTVGSPMAQTTLYFGMSRPHGPNITQAQWQQFVDQVVTPRFKDGLTVFNGQGQWLGHDGHVAKENSRALMLIHGMNDADSENKVEALRGIYKTQFQQESVMRVDSVRCVSF